MTRQFRGACFAAAVILVGGLSGGNIFDLRPNGLERAVYDDLGIKLEPKRLPADIVVIDDIRMPTPN